MIRVLINNAPGQGWLFQPSLISYTSLNKEAVKKQAQNRRASFRAGRVRNKKSEEEGFLSIVFSSMAEDVVAPIIELGKRKRAKTSSVWQYFKEVDGEWECQLTNCKMKYKTAVTSTLKRHINTHPTSQIVLFTNAMVGDIPLEERITNWVITSMVPFRVIDSVEFKCLFVEPIPSRKALKDRVKNKFKLRKLELTQFFEELDTKISFTTDIWTSINRDSFMGVTAHFSNQFELKHVTLALRKVNNHVGSHLAEIFFKILEEFKIIHKIGWITCDNASNNDTFFEKLQVLYNGKGQQVNLMDRHVRCLCHVINLVVQQILSSPTNEQEESTAERRRRKRLSSNRKRKPGNGEFLFIIYIFYFYFF